MKKAFVLLALLLGLAALCGCVTNEQIQNYNAGVEAYNAGSMELAKACFERAKGYANSRSYLSSIAEYERIYVEALEAFEARDYASAKNSFGSISMYENAAEYVAYIDRLEQRYNEGLKAFEEQDYVTARMRFIQAQGYEDSAEYAKRISKFEDSYQIAMAFFNEGNYLEALEAFGKIGTGYKDTLEKIDSIYELYSKKSVAPRTLLELFTASCASENEPVKVISADINEGSFAARTDIGLIIMGNTGADGLIETVSFWAPKELQKERGLEGMDRLYAHCIRSLTVSDNTFDEIYSKLAGYLDGAAAYGDHSILLTSDSSGATVLTADYMG